MTSKQEALAEVHASRAELEKTLGNFRDRVSPPQLAEDLMNLLDPDLTLLGRIKSGVQQNRLLSLAVLAGAGWLVGAPRRSTSEPRKMREADTKLPRTILKENNNDSRKNSGNQWPVSEPDAAKEQGAKSRVTQGRSKTQDGSGIPPRNEQQREPPVVEERIEERLSEDARH